jgi:hypothetical protein
MLSKEQLEIGKKIEKERKNFIFDIYALVGNLSELKLRDVLFSNDSPLEFIYSIPDVLYMYMYFSMGVPKNMTSEWFKNTFI